MRKEIIYKKNSTVERRKEEISPGNTTPPAVKRDERDQTMEAAST